MSTIHSAGTCRWAVPTLFLPSPVWADAADRPWTCVRDPQPHELESTDACARCTRWEARDARESDLETPCAHRRAQPYFLDIFTR